MLGATQGRGRIAFVSEGAAPGGDTVGAVAKVPGRARSGFTPGEFEKLRLSFTIPMHRRERRSRTVGPLFGLVLVAGCTSMLGIDGNYVVGLQEDGGLSAAGGTGGPSSGGAGGALTTGGAAGTVTSCESDSACPAGTKCCAGGCIAPQPLVGCAPTGCTRCPAPPTEGTAICNGATCGIQCKVGYAVSGNDCVPSGSGGAAGSGGVGGQTAGSGGGSTCDPKSCKNCSVAGPLGCCKHDGTCGCTWAPGAICY